MKIHKGDNVQIMAGKDRGKTGKVAEVDAKNLKILVQGLNLFKKHQKPKKQGDKGEIISVPRFLDYSNVQLFCGSCNKPVRAGFKMEGDAKVRYCKKCQAAV